MSRLLSIHEAAEAEINEAADFYDHKIPQLGSMFINEIQRAINGQPVFDRDRLARRVLRTMFSGKATVGGPG
jgi:hypothetical protein